MTHDPNGHPPREASWRKLSQADAAELDTWLASHPDAQPDWEAETRLTEALSRLPDAPLASNFTARVLQAVERETAATHRAQLPTWWQRWRRLAKFGLAGTAALVAGLLVVEHHQQSVRRAELANSIAKVSSVASLPSPEILQDFEAIRVLKTTPARVRDHVFDPSQADEQLLALLQ
jgi:anti-sigma factor RsiW